MATHDTDIVGLFPTPLMRVSRALDDELVAGLIQHFGKSVALPNSSSPNLAHSALLKPSDSPLLVETAARLTSLLPKFGELMFGEQLGWALKEMWVNVLDTGGRQAMHNHANSFISGVVYLTPTHADARTVFLKSPGGSEFTFRNDHSKVTAGAFNADKWIGPAPDPGDVVLFPSYLMHTVPVNPGARRVTLAFNAIPTHLDSWGYRVSFSG